MVGIGETDEEIIEEMKLLRTAGVDMITLGQYLQPSHKHLPVSRFPEPNKFAIWDGLAREMGFKAVASGPLVRSSYRAGFMLLLPTSCIKCPRAKGPRRITNVS